MVRKKIDLSLPLYTYHSEPKTMAIQIEKRNGTLQPLDISKIVYRIDRLIRALDDNGEEFGRILEIDANSVALEVCQHVKDGIKSTELDEITAEICAYKILENPDYNELAKRLVISNNHKSNRDWMDYRSLTHLLNSNGRFSQAYLDLVDKYGPQIDAEINSTRDYIFLDYFGYKTLEKTYLISTVAEGHVVRERPQHLFMREALEIHRGDLERVFETYHDVSQFYFTHATPTLFNSGHEHNQLSSCFLVANDKDSIEGMYENARRFAHISKHSGGIGTHLGHIRGNNAIINSSGGRGSGLIPYIRTLNSISKHVDQGGKRKGSMALYLEPHHPDILEFLELKKNTGNEEFRARDVFPALFVNDLFMQRVKQAILQKRAGDGSVIYWSLMCPKECPGLMDAYGPEFTRIYTEYERQGKFTKQLNVLDVWNAILDSQMETSLPYMVYKNAANRLSNQQNIGTIKCSNLCSEILEVSTFDEVASCNLASISLPKFVNKEKSYGYDLELLSEYAGKVTRNLNNVIDNGFYPTPQIKRGNFRHRPIGIGVQGLADVFYQLRHPYDSPEAQKLNSLISEAIYYGAVRMTIQLAKERATVLEGLQHWTQEEQWALVHTVGRYELLKQNLEDFNRSHTETLSHVEAEHKKEIETNIVATRERILNWLEEAGIETRGFNWTELQYWDPTRPVNFWGTYSSFDGSPASRGQFHFDLSGDEPSGLFDWAKLKTATQEYGWRNSLLVALMPTASTAQIMGNTECFEPATSNLYSRSVLSGNFMIVNKYLQKDLMELGLWNREMVDDLIRARGSVQNITRIPKELRDLYKTSWEISKKTYLKMARDRQAYIDQSQSLNLFISEPTPDLLTTVHLYGWELGLKTGMYYLRRRTVANAQQFSVEATKFGKSKSPTSRAPTMPSTPPKKENNTKENVVGAVCPLNPSDNEVCEMCSS